MPRMFQWFLELHFELGNPITNHGVSLEGYFPPVGALKSSAKPGDGNKAIDPDV